jgi:hypothetical protein
MAQIIKANTSQLRWILFNSTSKRKKPRHDALLGNLTDYTTYECRSRGNYCVRTVPKNPAIPPAIYDPGLQPNMENAYDLERTALDYTIATNKALLKIKDEKFNLGVFLAEGPETLRFLAGGVKTLYDMYRAARRGDIKRLREQAIQSYRKYGPKGSVSKLADVTSSLWMMYRYAIMPIVYDIQGLVDEYNRTPDVLDKIYRVSAGSKTSKKRSVVHTTFGTQEYKTTTQTRVTMYYRVKADRTKSRLGLINLPLLLWEVTPLSFVVDWIIPIGDAIGGLDARYGVEFVSGYKSARFNVDLEWPDFVYDDTLYHYVSSNNQAANESYCRAYIRTKLTSMPLPSLVVSPSMSVKRWLDALALSKLLFLRQKQLPRKPFDRNTRSNSGTTQREVNSQN